MAPQFSINERLVEARCKTLGQAVPIALHERIDALCDRVYNGGHERPSKRKMLAAVLLAAPEEADQLVTVLAAYDRATVKESLLADAKVEGDVVEFPVRAPGPRSAS